MQPDVNIKELSAATAGELVSLDFGGAPALAILMHQTGQSTTCAFLETNDTARAPFFLAVKLEGVVCISYGTEWLLDLDLDADTYPGNNRYSDKHGVIHIGNTVVAMNLNHPPDNIRLSAAAFDLKTFQIVNVHHRTHAPVASWKIWRTPDDKNQTSTKPLLTFRAPQR